MRVLFLCNLPAAVNTGGHQRLSHLLRAVASAGEVTLVYPIAHNTIGPDLEALRPFCKEVCTFPWESLAYQRDPLLPLPIFWTQHKLRYFHPVDSALMQQMRSTEANAMVASLCLQEFDLVWCNKISSTQMLPRPLKSRVIVDLDDLEHRKLRAQLQLWKDPPHMVPLYWFEFLRLRKLERSLHKLPYEFAVCSEIDRQAIGGNAKSWVIPNGVDMPTGFGQQRKRKRGACLSICRAHVLRTKRRRSSIFCPACVTSNPARFSGGQVSHCRQGSQLRRYVNSTMENPFSSPVQCRT